MLIESEDEKGASERDILLSLSLFDLEHLRRSIVIGQDRDFVNTRRESKFSPSVSLFDDPSL